MVYPELHGNIYKFYLKKRKSEGHPKINGNNLRVEADIIHLSKKIEMKYVQGLIEIILKHFVQT